VQGDISNLLGCILTGMQLPLTSLTAYYFCLCDVVMMIQYTYYMARARRREVRLQRQQKPQALMHASSAASEALLQYDAANALVMLHPARHLSGNPQHNDVRDLHRVHSVPSALLHASAWPHHFSSRKCVAELTLLFSVN
jgi:hypothetical protein